MIEWLLSVSGCAKHIMICAPLRTRVEADAAVTMARTVRGGEREGNAPDEIGLPVGCPRSSRAHLLPKRPLQLRPLWYSDKRKSFRHCSPSLPGVPCDPCMRHPGESLG